MSVYDYNVRTRLGESVSLDNYKDKVLLVVNTASKCGFTHQLEDLEKLYQTYQGQGLEIIGFPCNQFANQDPGTNAEIETFCRKNYGVSFTMFAKIDVNGKEADPFYDYLKSQARGFLGTKRIKWNFTKFLVGRDGRVVKRFATATKPGKLIPAIERELGKTA